MNRYQVEGHGLPIFAADPFAAAKIAYPLLRRLTAIAPLDDEGHLLITCEHEEGTELFLHVTETIYGRPRNPGILLPGRLRVPEHVFNGLKSIAKRRKTSLADVRREAYQYFLNKE